jgi:hypothetical protein
MHRYVAWGRYSNIETLSLDFLTLYYCAMRSFDWAREWVRISQHVIRSFYMLARDIS